MISVAQMLLLSLGPHGGPGPGCPFGFFRFGFFPMASFWLAAALGVVIWMRSGGFGSGDGDEPGTPPGPPARQAAVPVDDDGPEWPVLHPDEAPRPSKESRDDASRGPIGYF